MRVTGCPNGCGRAMLAEVGLVGKARVATTSSWRQPHWDTYPGCIKKTSPSRNGASLDELIGRWAKEREAGEGFGDFTVRAGIIRPVLNPARDLWDNHEPGLVRPDKTRERRIRQGEQ